jgi:hypothetical protein
MVQALLKGLSVRQWLPMLLVVGLAACSVNPVPEPPAKPETSGPIAADGCLSCDGAIVLSGATKNADVVWAVNLDRTDPPTVVDVAADGSFELALLGTTGDEVRIQARRDTERSDPRDYVVPDQGDLIPAARPLFDCLPAPLELDLGELSVGAPAAVRALDLASTCADAVTLQTIDLRAPAPAFTLQSSPVPIALGTNQTESIQVSFAPTMPGPSEEILLVEITAPVTDRRAVTLFGRGAP